MKKIFSTTGIAIFLGFILLWKGYKYVKNNNNNDEVYNKLKDVIQDSYREAQENDSEPKYSGLEDDSYE